MKHEDLVHENEMLRRRVGELEALNRRLAKTEGDLRRSESKFRKTFDYAAFGMAIIGLDGRLRQVNEALVRMLGYSEQDLLGLTFQDLTHPEDLKDGLNLFKDMVHGRKDHGTLEKRYIRNDGGVVWAILSTCVVPQEDGQPSFLVSQIQDVTDQRKAEEVLLKSEEKHRTIVETANEGIWSINAEGKTTYVNKIMAEMLGYSIEEMTGASLYAFMGEKERLEAERLLGKRKEGVSEQHEFVFRRKDGTSLWAIVSTRAQMDDQGNFLGAFAMITDITEQKKVADALQKSERRFRELVENLNDVIFSINIDGIIAYVSPSIERVLGYSPTELVGLKFHSLIHHDDLATIVKSFQDVLEIGLNPSEFRIRAKSGEYLWVRSSSRPILKEGKSAGISGVLMDITERKLAEDQLRETSDLLKYIVRNDPNAIAVYDRNLHYLAVSKRYLQDYNVKETDIIGKHHYEVFPEMPQRWKDVHERCLRGASESNDDDYFERPDGSITYNRWECIPWYESSGDIGGIITYTEVTTERKLAEKALKESEQRFRLAMDATSEGLWDWDISTDEVYSSPAFFNMLGYESGEWPPEFDEWTYRIHEEDRPKVLSALDNYLTGKSCEYSTQFRTYHKSGDIVWIRSRGKVCKYDDEGKPLRMVGTHEDITDSKKAEEAIRQSETRFRQIFELSPDANFIYDYDGYIDCNESCVSMLGLKSREDLLSRQPTDISPEFQPDGVSSQEKARAMMEIAFSKGSHRFDWVCQKPDGTPVYLDITANRIMLQGKAVIHAMGRDIGERKKAEESVAKKQRLLEEAEKLAGVGAWEWDLVDDTFYMSDGWLSIHGSNDPSPSRESLMLLAHPEDREAIEHAFNEVIEKGVPYEITHRIIRQNDGQERVVRAHGYVVRDASGKPSRMYGASQDITEPKKAEHDLKQSRKAFTNIVEKSADGILVVSLRGNILYANDSATQLIGYGQDHLMEMPFGATAGSAEDLIIQIIRSDGEIRDVEMRTAPTEWFGQPARIVMLRDMTERGRHEAALRREKEKREQYLNVAGIMFVVLDRNGNVVMVNRKTCEVLGRAMDELVGCDWFSTALPLEDRDEVRRMFDHLMEGQLEPYEYVEAPILRANGDTRLISWRNSLLRDAGGAVFGTVSSGEDITERKEMEARLKDSEERYRVLFEQSSEAIFIAGPEGEIFAANPATAVLFGVEPQDLTSLNIKDFYRNPDDRIAFRREVESKGFVNDYPLQMKQKDGTEKLCVLSSSLWKDREGRIIGYLSMLLDVTDHRRLEEQLRQAQKMESIGTLAGGVAHDFNNILTIIQGYSEMVLADKSEDHPDYADLSAVNSAAQRGADLVKQLMTFSRKVETEKRPVNLNKEVQTSVKLLSRTIPKMIDIRLELAPDIGRINADPGQMEQVIMNLAVNAKHAMPDGGTLTIETGNITLDEEYFRTCGEAVPGGYAYLIIEDTGHGMSKDIVDRVFEPFFSTKEQGEGTGLGLAMVYGIVKNHGGHIVCYSEPGVGTTFKIYLPVIEDVATSGEFKVLPEAPGGSETILLVDDEAMIRDLGRKMIEQAGYTVMVAGTGEEAVEIYGHRGREIDLVVLDLIMPGMGGHQALAELKAMDSDARVIIASGYSPSGHARTEAESGAAGFVSKPFRMHEVLRTVREVLDR